MQANTLTYTRNSKSFKESPEKEDRAYGRRPLYLYQMEKFQWL